MVALKGYLVRTRGGVDVPDPRVGFPVDSQDVPVVRRSPGVSGRTPDLEGSLVVDLPVPPAGSPGSTPVGTPAVVGTHDPGGSPDTSPVLDPGTSAVVPGTPC